jgi:hypothetical protein
MPADRVDGRRQTRDTVRGRPVAGLRGYGPIGRTIIALVVSLSVLGAIVLGSMVLSSLTHEGGKLLVATPTPSSTGCGPALWLSPGTDSCVPRAQCTEDQVFDDATNTCTRTGPAVAWIAPTSGPLAGGTQMTVRGTGFTAEATVTIDKVPAVDVRVVSPSTILLTTPPGSHDYPVDVVVTNPNGQAVRFDNSFTYVPNVYELTAVQPGTGSRQGGETVQLKGSGFVKGAVVTFNGAVAAGVGVVNSTTIMTITPAGEVGPARIVVANPDGTLFVRDPGFTYTGKPPRAVSSVLPGRGSASGGTSVTIRGSGFVRGAVVRFGSRSATRVTVVNGNTITAVTPSGPLGAVDVAVRNPGMPAMVLQQGYAYVSALTVRAVRPSSGPIVGGTRAVVTGTGFAKGATVTVDGIPATAVSVVNASTITATMPAGSTGPANVTVTNPNERPVTLTRAFTYLARTASPGAASP